MAKNRKEPDKHLKAKDWIEMESQEEVDSGHMKREQEWWWQCGNLEKGNEETGISTTGRVILFTWLFHSSSMVDAFWWALRGNTDLHILCPLHVSIHTFPHQISLYQYSNILLSRSLTSWSGQLPLSWNLDVSDVFFPFVSKSQGLTSFGGNMLYIAPEIIIHIKFMYKKRIQKKSFKERNV